MTEAIQNMMIHDFLEAGGEEDTMLDALHTIGFENTHRIWEQTINFAPIERIDIFTDRIETIIEMVEDPESWTNEM